jgi:hypothetical protein
MTKILHIYKKYQNQLILVHNIVACKIIEKSDKLKYTKQMNNIHKYLEVSQDSPLFQHAWQTGRQTSRQHPRKDSTAPTGALFCSRCLQYQ